MGIREHYTGKLRFTRPCKVSPFVWGVDAVTWRWRDSDSGVVAVPDHTAWDPIEAPDWWSMITRIGDTTDLRLPGDTLRPLHWNWGTPQPWFAVATSARNSRRRRDRRASQQAIGLWVDALERFGARVIVRDNWAPTGFTAGQTMVLTPATVAVVAAFRDMMCRNGQPVPSGLDVPDPTRWRIRNGSELLFPVWMERWAEFMPDLPWDELAPDPASPVLWAASTPRPIFVE